MEKDFFDLYEKQDCLSIEVGHTRITDWVLVIEDRKITGNNKTIVMVQHCDRKKVFAEAYDKLTDYLSENRGGY